METKQSLAAKVKNPANWIANVSINENDLLRYCGSLYDAALMESRMNGMGWRWARAGSFVSNNEGPCFVFAGANSTRYNIRPWKKVLPESFDTPVAAAAALILAGLVEVERAYIRGNR